MAKSSRPSSKASALSWLRATLVNRYFWLGVVVLLALGGVLALLVNNLLMPTYTRHEVAVMVPDVLQRPVDEASALLQQQDLQVETLTQRYNPALPRDVVIDQNPAPESAVKPGRRVYLTVNSGEARQLQVPKVEGFSLREAQNRVTAVGLKVAETRPDSIPSPHYKTITRQEPAAGETVPEGTGVTLWYSTGPGDAFVSIPDLTGLSVQEARQRLLDLRLRAVVFGAESDEEAEDQTVNRQSQQPGTRVREGFEVRLFVGEEEQEAPPAQL